MNIHVQAPGKVNITLSVGPRGSDGYHPLATIFQAVSVFEDLYAELADDVSVEVTGRDAEFVPTGDSNLAIRAARLLAQRAGAAQGVRLRIHKGVPVAGGMGGGSADAAASLVACNALWGTKLTPAELEKLGSELGADVPFALRGATALGTGRGDILQAIPARGTFHWVLVFNDNGMSTPEIFEVWDHLVGDDPPGATASTEAVAALEAGDLGALGAHLDNDLHQASLTMRPELGTVLDLFDRTESLGVTVSGSGPTIAALAPDGDAANRIAATVRAALHADGISGHVLVATGPAPGAHIVVSPPTGADRESAVN